MRSRSVLPTGPQTILAATLLLALAACAGKRAASGDAPEAPKIALEEAAKAAEASDLRKYIDGMDPIAHLDETNGQSVVMEPPANTGAMSSIAVVPGTALSAPLPPPRAGAALP